MKHDWIVALPDRLDTFLARQAGALSRTKIQDCINHGQVEVNETVVRKAAMRLQEGDRVGVTLPEETVLESGVAAQDLHLTVLHEDAACLVIDKPAGIAMHPGAGTVAGEATVLHGARHLFDERGIPFDESAVLVHRLDKDTTGCLLIAKTPAAHTALQKQFEERSTKKQYLAIVAGLPSPAAAVIDAPIGRSVSERTKMGILAVSGERSAQTAYRTLATGRHAALLLCEPKTGRTHQIRVHMTSIGHPILGDGTYANMLSERLTDDLHIHTLCLHAWKLAFTSPMDQKRYDMTAPVPHGLKEVIKKAGISWKE